MGLLLSLLVFCIVLCLLCWIVSIFPFPASAPPALRNIMYIIIALIAIVWLLDGVGFVNLSGHRWR
jgi:hypothetical protein